MATPKSKSKYQRDSEGTYRIVYESNVDAVNYYMFELSRAALRDVGKFVARNFKEEFYSNFQKISGDAGRVTKYKVWSSATTEHPRVQIGIKTGKVDGFYAYFQEFGTVKQKKLGLLSKVASENIAEIVRIESHYLSGLSDEADRLEALVDDSDEYEGDADE